MTLNFQTYDYDASYIIIYIKSECTFLGTYLKVDL